MKSSPLLFFLVLISACAWSQHSSNTYRELGDSLYNQHHFMDAAKYYGKALKNAPDPGAIMLKIGRSYGKLNEINKAEEWFSRAKINKASFSNNDVYQYAQVLSMQEKRSMAEAVLQDLMEKDPYARKEREFLDDVLNYKKYYKDSAAYIVKSLPINTTVSEFAPAYYKDGIVYSSATPENAIKQKYHWDNSHFLNLLYSKIVDNRFQTPLFFEKDLNTKYHDGPAVFYNDFNSMIVNRNQKGSAKNASGNNVWHMGLVEAEYSKEKASWQVSSLPFDETPYSFLHPTISEDGSTLYFVSDKPGGYGGTDIYRSLRLNGTWSEPFNLGPTINSDDNEVFPFFNNNTLYFASNGHGGLGGLDIYKSQQTVNGFSAPVNLGYPVNSPKDDFSFIQSKDQRTGYFSSSRNGNDDLFSFKKNFPKIPLRVHAYDGVTHESLGGATVDIISATAEDISVVTDSEGNFKFTMPEDTDYLLVASKDDKVGMLMGVVSSEADQDQITHQLPAYGDTTAIPCIGIIKDKGGIAKKAASIIVVDKVTGKEIAHVENNSLISFLGDKNHDYQIEIRNEDGDTTIHKIRIEPEDSGSKTWTMILKDTATPLTMAARIFNAADDQPLAGARVEVITFSEPQQELLADEEGKVDFKLPPGTTYLLIGSNANYSGMHSGVAQKGLDKSSIIHPVPAFGDKSTLENKLMVALITNADGEIVDDPHVTVKDKSSGGTVPVTIRGGLLRFNGEIGREYTVTVDHEDYNTFREEFMITEQTKDVEKISVVLQKEAPPGDLQLALRVFKDSDKSILSGASVTIISSSALDQELITDNSGVAEYTLGKGVAYLAIARKDHLVGNFMGTSEKEFSKQFVINPVPTFSEIENQIPVVAKIIDKNGNLISTAKSTVATNPTGEKISHHGSEGLVSFMAQPGKQYTLTAEDKNHKTVTHKVTISDTSRTKIVKVTLPMENLSQSRPDYAMGVRVIKAKEKEPLSGARVVVISFSEPDQEFIASDEGLASFSMTEGTDYMVVGSKDGYVGILTGIAEKGSDKSTIIHLIEAFDEDKKSLPVVSQIIDRDGYKIKDAKVNVTENSSSKEVASKFDEGFLSFLGEKGKQYSISVQRNGQAITHVHTVSDRVTAVEKISIRVPLAHEMTEEKSIAKGKTAKASNKSLIVFQTDTGASKVYFNDHDSFGEVIEAKGQLYLQKNDSSELLGNGELSTITSNVDILDELNITESETIILRNIYFDFNKAQLDDNDKMELEKVNKVLANFSTLQLIITAHADDRGQDTYNLNLSRKRAKAVGTFLIKSGIAKNRIVQKAMGETVPEVPCMTRECTEEEHQRNRRAEFVLMSASKIVNRGASPRVTSKKNSFQEVATNPLGYQEILDKYGNNKVDNLKIKISLGVYRFNPSLTFDELKNLGKIESVNEGGVTYYFLSDYFMLNEAEMVKKKVIEHGIKDAYFTFYHLDKRINLKEVVSLFE